MRTAIVFILLTPAWAPAQLSFERTTVDLGTVHGGQSVEAVFHARNSGPNAVEIGEVERSCGCIAPRWSATRLAPGESATLTLRIRTLGQPDGPRVWPLAVVARTVNSQVKHELRISADIVNDITLTPPQLAIYVADSVSQDITIADRRPKPLRVVDSDVKLAGLRIEPLEAPAGQSRLKLHVAGDQIPPGRTDHVILVSTDDPAYPRLEIPLTLVRVEKSQVAWTPEVPELILANGQPRTSVIVEVRGVKNVGKVVADDGLKCMWVESGERLMIRVMLDRTGFVGRGLQSAFRIHADGQTIAVPVVVRLQ